MVRTGRAGDDAAETRAAVDEALEGVEIAVVCGGVSVGVHDHVRPSLAELGVKEEFWGLALKPGSPAWFGRRGATLVFGLPGNPVSAMVTFVLLVGPALRAMLGRPVAERDTRRSLDGGYEKPAGRAHAVRCRLHTDEDGLHATPTGPQGSHVLSSMLGADAPGDDPERDDARALRRDGRRRIPARVDMCVSPAPEIDVEVRLFAMLRERAGSARRELRLPAGATVADALALLAERDAPLGELLARLPVSTAVNREYAAAATVLETGDELALIPPVSGGEPAAIHVAVSAEPLSAERLTALVDDPRAGAIVVFQGVTREIAALDYEAYAEMASEQIEAILRESAQRHGLCAAAAEHRVGRVAARRAERDRRRLLAAPRGSVRRGPGGDRRDQGAGADLEARGGRGMGRRGPRPKRLGSARERPADPPRRGRPRPHGRRVRQAGDARASPGRGRACACRPAPPRRSATARVRRARCLRLRAWPASRPRSRPRPLIPLAHPLALSYVDVEARVEPGEGLVELIAEARTTAGTGVEMEAMTAAAVAALTVYDMVKGLERGVEIEQVVAAREARRAQRLPARGGSVRSVRGRRRAKRSERRVEPPSSRSRLRRRPGEGDDESGPRLAALAERLGLEVIASEIVPDDRSQLEALLRSLADERRCALVLTSGGTGLAASDSRPRRRARSSSGRWTGLGEAMRGASQASHAPTGCSPARAPALAGAR